MGHNMYYHIAMDILWVVITISLYVFITKQNKKIDSLTQQAFLSGKQQGIQEQQQQYAQIKATEQDLRMKGFLHIGAMVISCSNEWQELSVGKIVDFQHDLPIIDDVITGQRIMGGLTIPYSKEMLHALMKLDPFERWSLLVARKVYSADEYIFNKKKIDTVDAEKTISILKDKNFI